MRRRERTMNENAGYGKRDLGSRRTTWVRALVVLLTAGLATMVLPAVQALARTPRCFGDRATIVGTARADAIRGTAGDDVIVALGGADVISGRGGDDRICGGNGNDRIVAGPGGFDVLFGEAGNDELLGGGGFDVLLAGAGNDLVDGGRGSFDIVSVFFAPGPTTVDLAAGTSTGEGTDEIRAVEQVEGSAFDDAMTGDASANSFYPYAGNDVVVGAEGLDTVRYIFSTAAVTVDLTAGTATGDGSDTLSTIEAVDGSDHNDTITGSAGLNILTGGSGDDVINGADGDDLLDGGDGSDSLDGGIGTDTCTNGETVLNCEV
jgi:Ca2+-binding RTX toxin-like protein